MLKKISIILLLLRGCSPAIGQMNDLVGHISMGNPYPNVNKTDTVKAVLLISECDTCILKAFTAYAIRKIKIIYVEPDCHNCITWDDPYKEVPVIIGYLNKNKKSFPKSYKIWQAQ